MRYIQAFAIVGGLLGLFYVIWEIVMTLLQVIYTHFHGSTMTICFSALGVGMLLAFSFALRIKK